MSSASTPTSSFDVLAGPIADELLAAAATFATVAVNDPSHGVLVIVVRPEGDHQVIAGGGTGILRAAVSVAVAAGNDRAWRDAPDGDTHEQPVRALPEVITAAAEADGVRAVHTGCVRVDGAVESVAIWFETWDGVATADQRREALAGLAAAGGRERERRAALAASAPAPDDASEDGASGPREFDPDDPNLDALTGLVHVERWAELIDEFDRDEAMLVLLDLDGFAGIAAEWGDDVSDRILREIADRLVANCRRDDVIARLGHDRFAVLFGAIDRSQVVEIAKRLLAGVAEPLPADLGPDRVTATVALSHQVGLVDLEEMLDSATDALASGKRSGAGRIVLAA
jgi:diguanylate cyclase (GGDEF)-like protein